MPLPKISVKTVLQRTLTAYLTVAQKVALPPIPTLPGGLSGKQILPKT